MWKCRLKKAFFCGSCLRCFHAVPPTPADNAADRARRRDRGISLENRFHLFIFLFLSSCVFGDGLPIRVVESHE